MKLNWNFLGGDGVAKQKTFHGVSMDIIWNYKFFIKIYHGEDDTQLAD